MQFGFTSFLGTAEIGAGLSWAPPPGCLALLNLTPPAQMQATRLAPGARTGNVLALMTDAAAKADDAFTPLVSEDLRTARPDAGHLDTWQSLTKYRPQGDTFAALLMDHLTTGADPQGLDACRPLMPQIDLQMPLWFAGAQIACRSFRIGTDPHANKVRAVLRSQLCQAKADALNGKLISALTRQADPTYYRRIADSTCEKFAGIASAAKAELLAALCPEWDAGDSLLPHATSTSDNFDRADGSMGTSSSGWIWNGLSGAMSISSLQARVTSVAARYRAAFDLTSSDNESSCTVTTAAGNVETMARYQSGADTSYRCVVSSTQVRIFTNVGGVQSQIGATSLAWPSVPFTIGMRCNGSTVSALVNGAVQLTASNFDIGSGTRGGIGGSGATGQFYDDWSMNDLAATVWNLSTTLAAAAGVAPVAAATHGLAVSLPAAVGLADSPAALVAMAQQLAVSAGLQASAAAIMNSAIQLSATAGLSATLASGGLGMAIALGVQAGMQTQINAVLAAAVALGASIDQQTQFQAVYSTAIQLAVQMQLEALVAAGTIDQLTADVVWRIAAQSPVWRLDPQPPVWRIPRP